MSSIPSHNECVAKVKYQHQLEKDQEKKDGNSSKHYQYDNLFEREACVERELLIGIQGDIQERKKSLQMLAIQEKQKPKINVSTAKRLKLMYDQLKGLEDALEKAISACTNAIVMKKHSAVWMTIPERQLRLSARRGEYRLVAKIVENINKAITNAMADIEIVVTDIETSDEAALNTQSSIASTGHPAQDSQEDIQEAEAGLDEMIGGVDIGQSIPDPNAPVTPPRPKLN